jgi:hypothetical protein|tara:strand:+ start:564 stop:1112 length:549 start_codon:yes stop_codon:yes gene_type:complete
MSGVIGVGPDETSGIVGKFPSGHVLQQTQTVIQSAFTIANTESEQLITGFNVAITPISAHSKVHLSYKFETSCAADATARAYMERDIAGAGYSELAGIQGTGATPLSSLCFGGGTQDSWMLHEHAGSFLDTPTYTVGGEITYRIGLQTENGGNALHVGQTHRDTTLYHPRTASILILQEISA